MSGIAAYAIGSAVIAVALCIPSTTTTTTAAPVEVIEHPVIETPCHEDQIAMVVHHTYEPKADDLGYWDGDRYFRLCVAVDDMLIIDGRLVPNVDE